MSKAKIAYLVALVIFIGVVVTWNYTIRKPQINTATTFLEALKCRDATALKQVVVPSEYYTYKDLYLKNGFNKHLLNYGKVTEKDANNHFFPTQSRFEVKVNEDDIFFGNRTHNYLISLQKEQGRWKVLQFVTLDDYSDLAKLRELKQSTAVN